MSTELTTDTFQSLRTAIQEKTALVGVVGLGYVGLPLIQAFIKGGYRTIGYDVDDSKVSALKAGRSYIKHISEEWIAECVQSELFEPTADMARLAEADAILICVPTPLSESRDPDVSYIESTAAIHRASMRPGQLVVLESTTYPGTTRDVVQPILDATGLQLGKDYFLAYSPEREDPGNPDFNASRIPKVVGGMNPASLELALALYSQAVVKTCPSRAAKWRKPARSSRTPIAQSTSRWSTN